jgi:hypothetical protein
MKNTVARKLGNVVYWLSCILAIVIAACGLFLTYMALSAPISPFVPSQTFADTVFVPFFVWRIGRAFRYPETIDRSIDPPLEIALGVGIGAVWVLFGECYHVYLLEPPDYYPRTEPFCTSAVDMMVFGIWYRWILAIGMVLVLRGAYRIFRAKRASA